MITCIQNGDIDTAKNLLLETIQCEILNEALITASKMSNCEIVKLLLENGADINAVDDYARSALVYSARNGCYEIVKLLLENGANIHQFTALISLRSARKLGFRWVC